MLNALHETVESFCCTLKGIKNFCIYNSCKTIIFSCCRNSSKRQSYAKTHSDQKTERWMKTEMESEIEKESGAFLTVFIVFAIGFMNTINALLCLCV